MTDNELRAVFAVGPAANGDSVFVIGIPKAALDKMLANPGWGLPIDLSSAGVPMVVSIFAGTDRADCVRQIKDIAKTLDIPFSRGPLKEYPIKDRRS